MAQERRYLDVNIFVYWLTSHPDFGQTAHKWIKKIEENNDGQFITSSLSLYETLVVIAGLIGKTLKDKTLTSEIIKAITGIKGLTIEPLKPEDFTVAVDLMNDYKLDYEDSLHLAVAIRMGVKEIVSNDKDFNLTPIKGVFKLTR